MKNSKTSFKKKCKFCRRVFPPSPRIGDKQVSCNSPACRKQRKRLAQRRWHRANPTYFHERYKDLRLWREKNPGYQKKWRREQSEIQDKIDGKDSIKTIRLMVPTCILKNEIKDEIILKHKYSQGVRAVFVHEIKDKIGITEIMT